MTRDLLKPHISKKLFFLVLMATLLICTSSHLVYGGDFTTTKKGETVLLGKFDNEKDFIQLLKNNLATPQQIQKKMNEAYGILYFIMIEPKNYQFSTHLDRIADYFRFPERYGYHADEFTRLYSDKEEAVSSAEMIKRSKENRDVEIYIIGVSIKDYRMHSINKSNGLRIYVNPWFED